MSSQSNFSEEDARGRAAEGAFPDPDNRRPRAHGRKNSIAHHKGQETTASYGGRTAARQQAITDSSRGRGRAANEDGGVPLTRWAYEVLYQDTNYGQIKSGVHPDVLAARLDPRKSEPLPPDHPEVRKEIKFDRIARLMQPGSNDEVDQQLGLDDNDDWIS